MNRGQNILDGTAKSSQWLLEGGSGARLVCLRASNCGTKGWAWQQLLSPVGSLDFVIDFCCFKAGTSQPLMPSITSARLLRRPLATVAVILTILILYFLRGLDKHSTPPLSGNLNPAGWKTSPYYYNRDQRHYSTRTPAYFPPVRHGIGTSPPDLCAGFPVHLLKRIQVVVKAGIGESAKNQAHLRTVSSCITNLLVFSDVEETIGSQKVIDVLADLPDKYSQNNPDFEAYAAQKKEFSENGKVGRSGEGWKLDRFKFLPMVERAYKMRPNARWYVFLETDTYYFWDTLFRLLHQLDPTKMHYLGSPSAGSFDRWFAYGGAGFVMSQGLMTELVGKKQRSLSEEYFEWVRDDCCGDSVLAYAIFNRTGVRLEGLYPTFAGDELNSLRVDKERWCIPLLALHRLSPDTMKALWQWERTRPYSDTPFTHSNILGFTLPQVREKARRDNWDNLSDLEQPPDSSSHQSIEACGSACAADPECLQYSHRNSTCKLSHYIQQGKEVLDTPPFTSGWDTEKLLSMGWKGPADSVDACGEATWIRPNT